MKILIAGGFDEEDAAQEERVRAFSDAMGQAVIEHGHVLLNGCRTEFDRLVATLPTRSSRRWGSGSPTTG